MSENTIKINQIPSPTWNWLGMNEAIIDMGVVCSKDDDVKITLPDDIEASVKESDYGSDIKGAMGEVFDENLARSAGSADVLTLGDNVKCKTPVVISAEFKKECAGGKRFVIEAGRGSELTVLQDFSSEENASGRGCMQTLVSAGEGAKVKIIQIARLNGDYELLNDLGVTAQRDAHIEVVHIFLGGNKIYQGCNIDLAGDNSSVKKDIGYFLRDEQDLDMNYVVVHKGKETRCDIKASGVLEGQSSKLFRGTIDFRNGCAGAKGAEIEEVILRDDTVSNKTIPVILCAEEDVEGSHGATIGRLDEDLIFYMQTRGLEEEEIYRLISENRLLAFCDKIPDGEIRKKTMTYLSKEQE